jgi:Na+/proline symporter/nitrogen-specific signal transduction histidine kinase
MLAMILGWLMLRKMIRIAKTYRITSIADFISSRYGKSPMLAGVVTLITVVGIIPYIALQLKGISVAYAVLTTPLEQPLRTDQPWWQESTFYIALLLAGFTMMFGARHLDNTERHEGMVAAIAFESLVKLIAFLAVGLFVSYGLFNGVGDIFQRAAADPNLANLLELGEGRSFAYAEWFTLTLLAMFSVILLPRQFQVMVVENVNERHLKRAVWVFPLYLFLINLFVLPIALGGVLYFGAGQMNPETFILSLPLAEGWYGLALLAFIGGLSAATGMVIVESIAVSTMVCNDLVMPWLLRSKRWMHRQGRDLSRLLLNIRRAAILVILLLGYLYYRLAGEAYALVSIGLISFAAVAQFAPALLGGMYWKGGTRQGALAGLVLGFAVWVYTLMLPSLAKSGWMSDAIVVEGLFGNPWLRPEALLGLTGLDNLTHSLFWSMLLNVGAYVAVSLWRSPSARETSQAVLFVDVFERTQGDQPVFWRGQASVTELFRLAERFLGAEKAQTVFLECARQRGVASIEQLPADAALVQWVETQLAGSIGSASARVMVASVVKEESLEIADVLGMLDEANRLRLHSQELEEKSRSLEAASAELRAANEQLKSLDQLKDEFMSSVTHELRTPLTAIRSLSELMRDDPKLKLEDRKRFLAIIVSESERLSRLVNQVLDMAKIESGHAQWHDSDVDLVELVRRVAATTAELLKEKQCQMVLELPQRPVLVRADADRLTQVMLNLISNAVKFVPAGRGLIGIRLRLLPGRVVIEVQDNGPGVAPHEHELVFEKFRQVGEGVIRPQGTGLGLPISRQIVEHFGGRMWLQGQPGMGATFGFELPFGDNDERDDTDRR